MSNANFGDQLSLDELLPPTQEYSLEELKAEYTQAKAKRLGEMAKPMANIAINGMRLRDPVELGWEVI